MLVVALLGIWQFININTSLNIKFLSDWTWASHLNPSISGWGMSHDRIAYIGSINRAASFAHEPAHLALFLIGASGFSLLVILKSLDFPERRHSINLIYAVIILAGFAASLSLTGFFSFLITLAVFGFCSRKSLLGFMMILTVIILPLIFFSDLFINGTSFGQKMASVSAYTFFFDQKWAFEGHGFSTLTHMLHAKITALILSDHPFFGIGIGRYIIGHAEYSPIALASVAGPITEISKMNANDANSLLFRMLSETGLVSTAFFLSAVFLIIRQPLKWIQSKRIGMDRHAYLLTFGLILSLIGYLVSHLLRMGAYHHVELWLLLAVAASLRRNHAFWEKFALEKK
jgi:hypothetical protein